MNSAHLERVQYHSFKSMKDCVDNVNLFYYTYIIWFPTWANMGLRIEHLSTKDEDRFMDGGMNKYHKIKSIMITNSNNSMLIPPMHLAFL